MALVGHTCWQAVRISPSRIAAIFFLGLDLRLLDALHAVGALFHDAAAAHGHVRIADPVKALRVPIRE